MKPLSWQGLAWVFSGLGLVFSLAWMFFCQFLSPPLVYSPFFYFLPLSSNFLTRMLLFIDSEYVFILLSHLDCGSVKMCENGPSAITPKTRASRRITRWHQYTETKREFTQVRIANKQNIGVLANVPSIYMPIRPDSSGRSHLDPTHAIRGLFVRVT